MIQISGFNIDGEIGSAPTSTSFFKYKLCNSKVDIVDDMLGRGVTAVHLELAKLVGRVEYQYAVQHRVSALEPTLVNALQQKSKALEEIIIKHSMVCLTLVHGDESPSSSARLPGLLVNHHQGCK